jgi:hypothetical protein
MHKALIQTIDKDIRNKIKTCHNTSTLSVYSKVQGIHVIIGQSYAYMNSHQQENTNQRSRS